MSIKDIIDVRRRTAGKFTVATCGALPTWAVRAPRCDSTDGQGLGASLERALMERYSYPCVVVDEKCEVVYVSARADRFLEARVGKPTRAFLEMVRDGLRPTLRSAIHKAISEQRLVVFLGQKFSDLGEEVTVNLLVEPVSSPPGSRKFATVVFEPAAPTATFPAAAASGAKAQFRDEASSEASIRRLEEQPLIQPGQLQTAIEQLENSNPGLLSSNEEPATSRDDELRSLNEELESVQARLRRKVEELNQANDDMENLLENFEIAAVFLDRQCNIKRFTPSMAAICNLTQAHVGRPFPLWAGGLELPAISGQASLVLEGGACAGREVKDLKSDRCYLLRVLPYRTKGVGGEGVVVTLCETTQRKFSERSLSASEQRYRSLFQHMLEGFAQCRAFYDEQGQLADFVCLYANDAFAELTALENVVGRKANEATPGIKGAFPELFQILERVSLTGESQKLELDFKPRDCWLSISVYSQTKGEFEVILENITERKRIEGRLLEYRKIIEGSRDMVCVIDRDRRYLLANQAYLEYRNKSYHDLVGRRIMEVLEEGDLIQIQQHIDTCLLGGSVEFEMRREHPGKGVRDLAVSYAPIETGRGGYPIVCFIRDITEQRLLEAQLRQSQKMEAIGTLAGGVAHDFNNILTVIAGYAGLIQMDLAEGSPVLAMAGEIVSSVQRATEMTRQLLAVSRKQEAILSPVDLNGIVLGLVNTLSRLISEEIELSVNLKKTPLFAMADKGQMDQLIINLAVNARDAMPEGGRLVITTELAGNGAEESDFSNVNAPEGYGLITVADDGIGMDKVIQERIFEPFFTTKEPGKGTGLGLSMAYGIVQRHKGLIKVASEPGRGTVFKVYLPLSKLQPKQEQTERVEVQASSGSETILLVDDDESIRRVTKCMLEQVGYRVYLAKNGEEGLYEFRDKRDSVKLLITDMIMPKMNGPQLYEKIRELNPELPTIFMSGYPADTMKGKGFSREYTNYLAKPISPEALFARVREALAGKAPEWGESSPWPA